MILKLLLLQEPQQFVLSPGSCEKLLFDADAACFCLSLLLCIRRGWKRWQGFSKLWAESVSHLSRVSFIPCAVSVQKPHPGRAAGGILRLRQQFLTPHCHGWAGQGRACPAPGLGWDCVWWMLGCRDKSQALLVSQGVSQVRL